MSIGAAVDSPAVMPREPDLDRLTTLLGRCLGRIDERAYQLQLGDEEPDELTEHVLEHEAATLQELVGSLVAASDIEQCDLNRIVERAVSSCLVELGRAIVVRQRLAPYLPKVACTPGQIAYAVQRAFVIATGALDAGGELLIATRRDDVVVVLEVESRGGQRDRHLRARAETLCEFVASFGGICRLDHDERDNLLLMIELPTAITVDD